jgi:hypothetical protein
MRKTFIMTHLKHSIGGLICVLLLCMQMVLPENVAAASGSFEFGSAKYSVNEGAGKVTMTLKRSNASSGAASVQLRTSGGTADWRNDYDSFGWQTISFANGESEKTINLSITDDTKEESNETFNFILRRPSNGTTLGAISSAEVTIVDNDGANASSSVDTSSPGNFEFGAASYSVNEAAGKVDVLLKRTGGSAGAASVEVRTLGVTADYATDYDSFSWTVVNFADGQSQKTISISITDDKAVEDNETFTVNLRNPTGGCALGAVTLSTVTIVDNDDVVSADTTSPNAAITSPSGNLSVASAQTLTIVAQASDNVGVSKVEFYDGSKLLATDTTNTYSTTLTVAEADNGVHNLTVVAYDAAGNKTTSSPVAVTVNIATASTEPGSFQIGASTYSVNEGAGKVDVLIKRTGGSAGAASIEVRTLGVTADWATDYDSFSWTVVNFADGQSQKTISIAITDDSAVEDNETFTVNLRNPTGGTTLGATSVSTVTIVDNDTASSNDGTSDTTTTDPGVTDPVVNDPVVTNPNLGYLPVFPGAMGHGTETKAGRGGSIIRVTNLNDSGTGSLRAAIDASGPRIIVFEVSGTIKLATDLNIKNPFITLAGQTAPSPGINLRGAGMRITTHDVLVQHIRIRTGDAPEGPSPSNRDTLQVLGPNAYNVVVDHVSGCWSVDEVMSTWYALKDVTFSNNLLSEALYNSIHTEGPHSMGILLGDHAQNITVVGNLLAHCKERNPRLKGDVSAEIVNNVFYNAGTTSNFASIGSDSGPNIVSMVGNKFIAGPNTSPTAAGIKVEGSAPAGTKVYFKDNVAPGASYLSTSKEVSTPPIWHDSLVIRSSSEVEALVLSKAGARPADRDAVDARVVNEVRNRGGSIIDSQTQVGGWPSLANNKRTFNVPSNPNGDDDGDGYTNIEELLHSMAAQVE